ncbi:MAG TPA: DUF1003 domain-containing protein [Actinomycetota bacterium]|nr:DUF1003 domain-containing protein [Actinomycetota bacterium]
MSATNTTTRRNWFPWSGRHDLRHPTVKSSHDERTLGERVADDVARFGGSWPFIFLFVGLIAAWMVLNTVVLARVLHDRQWDPYPYIALNLMLSGIAGIQAPIIMMSQNRAAARDEALAGHHYAESQKSERMLVLLRELLEANTELTKQVHELTAQIHAVVAPGREGSRS